MKLFLYCLLAMLWPVANTHAQTTTKKTNFLTVGDTLPNHLVLENIINYPVSKIQLSDLCKQPVIIDFWAAWCNNCLNSFPLLDSLQREFKDRLQIIAVNPANSKDDEQKVRRAIQRVEKNTNSNISFPYTYQDSVVYKQFSFRAVPHYVWIASNGTIAAITGSDELTGENVQRFLSGKRLCLPVKMDREKKQNASH